MMMYGCVVKAVLLRPRVVERCRSAHARVRDASPPAPGSYCFYSPRRNASGQSRVLVPLVDMINHAGAGHNAHVAEAADGSISATATRDIAAGEEARPRTARSETPAHVFSRKRKGAVMPVPAFQTSLRSSAARSRAA